MKKALALLVVSMMVVSMTSCGGSSNASLSDNAEMQCGSSAGSLQEASNVSFKTSSNVSSADVENRSGDTENQPIVLENVTQAKNIILMIGDGMGPEQIKAGELFKGETLTMQSFPYMTKVETRSASDLVTDSGAASTAIATGRRTTNGTVGIVDYTHLETIVDIASKMGKSTGIIATEELYGATPMGFSGHAYTRNNQQGLLTSAANSSNVNLFASYKMDVTYQNIFTSAGYQSVENVDDISETSADKVFGNYLIKANAPSMSATEKSVALDRLVTEALDYLSKDEDGFFLMAEGSHIDHGGHNNDISYMLQELLAFDDAVQAVLEWAKDRDDTVVIVTADHETGGLQLKEGVTSDNLFELGSSDSGMTYKPLYYEWTTASHTSTDVNCYINGANIDFRKYSFGLNDRIKNTDIFKIMKGLLQG